MDDGAVRHCLRDPIPELFEVARLLDEAVTLHALGRTQTAEELISASDKPEIRAWTESLWGKNSPYVKLRFKLPELDRAVRTPLRMPSRAEKRMLHERDGYHCRFCGIPVVRREVRKRIQAVYPEALPWGATNKTQHAAFQAMWAQYDHIVPHALGGSNDLDNLVVTCAPCNFARMNYLLEQVGLSDPRLRAPVESRWDGLERFH